MRLAGTLGALAIAASVAACSLGTSMSNMYDRWFGSAPAVKPSPLPPMTATATPKIVWRATVGPAERSVFFPAVTGDKVYAAGAAGQVVGFEVKSGSAVNRINAGQKLAGGVAASGSLIVVGSAKGEVMAFDAAGKALWKTPLAGEVLAPAAI